MGFVIGLIVGGGIGVAVMCCLRVSAESENGEE